MTHTAELTKSEAEVTAPADGGKLIVLTAPLTETIDHAGYFIQMALASMPRLMEGAIDQKYPEWREVERDTDGSARYMPAGVRLVEASLLREFRAEDMVCCYPDDLPKFIGPRTRVVGVSTHNPLGVTFAAGVYASVFGTSREPINSHYAKMMFQKLGESPFRRGFQVVVGGSGGWQISQTDSYRELGIDCVVEGRSESEQVLELFRKAIAGEALPRFIEVSHPRVREALLTPDKRTTFGVVEMTTGCGRRCQFCQPDLNPQLDLPKDRIMSAVKANVREGNELISLATEDMFIWGQVGTATPFYFPNREALTDLYKEVVGTPGVKHHLPQHDGSGGGGSETDRGLIGGAAGQESGETAAAEQPSGRADSVAAGRAGDGVGADGEADHAGKICAVSDRGMAERGDSGADDSESQQLAAGDDADDREPGGDG
jgi:hypothetical protein